MDKINEILKDYQDIIPFVALTIENGSQLNDVETGMLYTCGDTGFAWDDFAKLENALHDSVKRYMPNILTSCEDIGWENNQFKYNDLKVDIIARQQYNPDAALLDIDRCYTTRPCYVGEFNLSEDNDVCASFSDEYYTNVMPKFYPNLIKQGYIGAFQFQFNTAFKYYSLFYDGASTDNYSKLKNYVIPVVYTITDCKNEYHGITGKDKPVLLYNNGSNNIYWIGGRNVQSFTVERSTNGGKWEIIAENINVYDNMLDNGLMNYTDSTAEFGKQYRYRIKALFEDGEVMVSEPGNITELYNPPESFLDSSGNYAGGFEQGGLTGNKNAANSDGWYNAGWKPVGTFLKGENGEARTGDYCLFVDTTNNFADQYSAQWCYNLQLEPNTTYTFSYWYKTSGGWFSMSVHDFSTDETLSWSSPNIVLTGENAGQWVKNEATFTAGSDGRIYIKLMNMKNSEPLVLYLDDLSIKEDR